MAAIASLNVNALFGKKAPAKKAPAKKTAAKKAPVRSAGVKRQGNIGPNRTLWNGWESNPEPPAYLDGSLPGDAGFDPFGLSKPVEYLQFDLDGLDGSAAVNPYGRVIGKLKKVDNKPTERTIVPFNEAFDIVRFRECELQHSRWAMLGLVGVIFAEQSTGISWVDAGKVLNEQPSYLGFNINVPLKTLVLIEVLAMGFAEVKRSAGTSPNASSGTARKVLLSRCLFSLRVTSVGPSRARPISFFRAEEVFRVCSDDFHPPRKKPSQSSTRRSARTPAATSTPSSSRTPPPTRLSSS